LRENSIKKTKREKAIQREDPISIISIGQNEKSGRRGEAIIKEQVKELSKRFSRGTLSN